MDVKRVPWLGRAVRVAIVLAALALGGLALADRWSEVSSRVARVGALPLVAALGFVAVAQVSTVLSWRALLSDLGSPLPVLGGGRIVWLSGLGKYLPGSVWPYLAQVDMARRYQVPRARSAAVSVMAVLVSLVMAVGVAALTMPWESATATRRFWPVFLAIPVLLVLLHPSVFNRALAIGLRLLRRTEFQERITWKGILVGAGWAAVTWVMFGLQIWVLADAMSRLTPGSPLICIGAYGLAWSAGLLFVIAPAGAGVREAALTAALSPIMPTSAALTVALLSRAVTTAGDIGAAAFAAMIRGEARTGDSTDGRDRPPTEEAIRDPHSAATTDPK